MLWRDGMGRARLAIEQALLAQDIAQLNNIEHLIVVDVLLVRHVDPHQPFVDDVAAITDRTGFEEPATCGEVAYGDKRCDDRPLCVRRRIYRSRKVRVYGMFLSDESDGTSTEPGYDWLRFQAASAS